MFDPDDVVAAARDALTAWRVEPREVSVLSISENVVCEVDTDGGQRLALRLHRPGYNTLDEMRSEVAWVESLASFGLPVPTQIATVTGDHFVEVSVGSQRCHAGLIEWVDGRPIARELHSGAPDIDAWYRALGVAAGRIRAHGRSWEPPAAFVRRRWDIDGLLGDDPLWGRFWESSALDDAQRTVLLRARETLADELSGIPTDGDHFGMIHADLHIGNVMVQHGVLTIIDFDDSGFGYYGYELAVALHPLAGTAWFDAARSALLDGYRSVDPDVNEEIERIDAFLAVRALIMLGWLDARPGIPAYEIRDEVAEQAVRSARRYLATR